MCLCVSVYMCEYAYVTMLKLSSQKMEFQIKLLKQETKELNVKMDIYLISYKINFRQNINVFKSHRITRI